MEPIVPDRHDSFLVALQQFPKRTIIKICGYSEGTCSKIYNTIGNVVDTTKNIFLAAQSWVNQKLGGASPQIATGQNVDTLPAVTEPTPSSPPQEINTASPVATTTPKPVAPVIKPAPKKIPAKTPVKIQPDIFPDNLPEIFPDAVDAARPNLDNLKPKSTPSIALGGGGAAGVPEAPLIATSNPESEQSAPDPTPAVTIPADATAPSPPVLDESFADIIYTTNTSAVVFGTVTTDTVALVVSSSPQQNGAIAFSSSSFSFSPTLNSGHNYFSFAALDAGNNTSSFSGEAHFIYDIFSPTVPNLTINNRSGASSTNINITLQSADDSPVFFDLQYSTNTLDWNDLAANTSTSEFNFSGERGKKYYFRSRARDILENESVWGEASNATYINYSQEVVINEIAWSGTSANPSHEWIELYNNSNESINLSGWRVLVSGRQLEWSKINNSIIPARGYYLYERVTDNAVKNIQADFVFNLLYGISNDGAKLELIKPDGTKADEVDASSKWFAGDNIKYRSMERRSSLVSGNNPANWQSNQGPRIGPRTNSGGQIYGSPKMSNFGGISLNYAQEDAVVTLAKENNPYYLEFYEIPAGKTLQIEPGVVIRAVYQASNMIINGSLKASGTSAEKVVFTSSKDGVATTTAKDWQGIWFKPGSSGTLFGVSFRYAGYPFRLRGNLPQNTEQAIRMESANVQINDSDFNDNGSLLIYSENSNLNINNSAFANGIKAIESNGSISGVSNSSFTNFSDGNGPFVFRDIWPRFSGLTFASSTDMVALERMVISGQEVTLSSGKYLVNGSLNIASSSKLIIESGAQIYLTLYSFVEVFGSLDARGTAENPVEFLAMSTSSRWGNLRFNNSTSSLNFVNIKNGNRLNGRPPALNGMLLVNNSNLEINNATLWDAEPIGQTVQATNSTLTVNNSLIGASEKYIVVGPSNVTAGIRLNSGALNLDNTSFENLYIGVMAVTANSPAINAQNMSAEKFVNVDFPTDPPGLLNFPTPTST